MKWLIKAAIQKSIGILPQPERVNYFLQRRVSKRLPSSYEKFCGRVGHAVDHFERLKKHLPGVETNKLRGYEFGAGWDLTIPLTYFALGIDEQVLVDIRPNIRFELVNEGLRKFSVYQLRLEKTHPMSLRSVCAEPVYTLEDLKRRFGITYMAPCDATATSLPVESFDFITSTYTLEHIPGPEIARILNESCRILKRGGIMSSLIDMTDHYASSGVSIYNYLKFSDAFWSVVNSPLHYQNRLRHSDYTTLMKQAGLEIVEEQADRPTPDELRTLQALRISPKFSSSYSFEDLADKRLAVIARRP